MTLPPLRLNGKKICEGELHPPSQMSIVDFTFSRLVDIPRNRSLYPDNCLGKREIKVFVFVFSPGLAKKDKIAFWESSLFVASGRSSREYVWEISPIGGRVLNWGTMVEPALSCLKEATSYLENNRPKKTEKYSWKKTAAIDIPVSDAMDATTVI